MRKIFVYLLLLAAALLIVLPCIAQKPDTATFQRRIIGKYPDGSRLRGVFAFKDSIAWIKADTLPADNYRVVRYLPADGILHAVSESATIIFLIDQTGAYLFVIPFDKRRYRSAAFRLTFKQI